MRLTEIDLNLLVVLDAVLSERNVARASERLHVTPSAVSNSLAKLRLLLRDPLLIRSGRGVVPTPRATSLAPALKQALAELEGIVEVDRFDPATTTRQFTLAVADAGQITNVPGLINLIAQKMPKASVRVVGIDTYISSGGLAGTEIDVALIAIDDSAPGIHAVPLYSETGVLAARCGNRHIQGKMTKARLARLEHVEVQVAPGRGYRDLAQAYTRLGIERNIAAIVPNFVAALSIVASTNYVATLPVSLLDLLGKRFALQVVGGGAPRISTSIKLAWHERTDNDRAMKAFRDLIIQATSARRRRTLAVGPIQ